MKKYIKLIAVFTVFMCILNIFSPVFAADSESKNGEFIGNQGLDGIFNKGGSWFNKYFKGESNDQLSKTFISEIFESGGIIDLITTVGYLIFFVAAAVLGIKYMMSGFEGKAFVKNGLVTYTIGVVFFYLSDKLVDFAKSLFLGMSSQNSFENITANIWTTFEVIISTLMVAIVVIYGVKYMWSSANDKANLKKGMVPMVIGAILIMCTLQIISFIVNISESALEVPQENKSNIINNLNFLDDYNLEKFNV